MGGELNIKYSIHHFLYLSEDAFFWTEANNPMIERKNSQLSDNHPDPSYFHDISRVSTSYVSNMLFDAKKEQL